MTRAVAPSWVPDDSTFGARLALIRQRMGWGNVKEAALACGIAPETWRSWEAKQTTSLPRNAIERAQAIADVTGADFYWLLTGKRQAGPDDGDTRDDVKGPRLVRHQGLEPRTRWFEVTDNFAAWPAELVA